jgi:excisionase family DNA binding protein
VRELLNTRQAAARLGVSEASVRRWSDAGQLTVRRVGRRGDRRFSPDDVDGFKATNDLHSAVNVPPREVIVGGAPIPVHTHLAIFYDSDEGRLRVTAPFLEAGLRAGEPCFLIASGEVLDAYLARFRQSGIDVEQAIENGRLTTCDAPGATVKEALEFWEQTLWKVVERGPVVIHAVGEMVSERERFVSESEMLAYETAVGSLLKRFPCIVLCQYDVRQFTGAALFEALRAHPDLYAFPLRTLIS